MQALEYSFESIATSRANAMNAIGGAVESKKVKKTDTH